MRPEHKEQVTSEVTARIVARYANHPERLSRVLGDTLYHERTRLERNRYPGEDKDIAFWKDIGKKLAASSTNTQEAMLGRVSEKFVREIMGHFDPRVYSVATRLLPTGLGALLTSLDPRRALKAGKDNLGLRENVIVKGEVEAARRLANIGTVVVVPNHISNLDSIVMGYAAYLMGLPPLLYGAGLNLFTNKFVGFFMSHLGAYTVDRRKKAQLYKEILKEYATYAMEIGYHSLFFPGGTRIRSGGVERQLKKGLLGTTLSAYQGNLRLKKARPNIYILPCTLSYGLVLEAKTLIEDHLKAVGKSRYIIIDDEFSKPRRIAQFFRELLKLNSKMYITFGPPLDPFGNRVDFQGRSLDPKGRPVDITRYVCRDGEVHPDPQRDKEYTSELSRSVVKVYEDKNRLQSTNLAAFTVFRLLKNANPGVDLYRLLREGLGPAGIPRRDVLAALDRVLTEVRQCVANDRLLLDPRLDGKDADGVLEHALRYFGSYHSKRPVKAVGERIQVDDTQLLFYYHNRLTGYGIEDILR